MVMLFAAAAALIVAANGAAPVGGSSDATPPALCRIMEAAYTAALEMAATSIKEPVIHPSTVVPDRHQPSALATWVPRYVAELPLSAGEFEQLKKVEGTPSSDHYLPNCEWTGIEHDVVDSGRHFTTSFAKPLLLKSAKLALVEVSFYDGRFGYGETCVVRQKRRRWSAACRSGWIT